MRRARSEEIALNFDLEIEKTTKGLRAEAKRRKAESQNQERIQQENNKKQWLITITIMPTTILWRIMLFLLLGILDQVS